MAIKLTIADNDTIRLGTSETSPLSLDAGSTTVVASSDYDELTHKPSINGVELIGNKTTADLGIEAGVSSFNGQTGDVTYTAPVESVNGQTGDVTVTEGLEPLIGTTSTVTPQQVMTAIGEGRDICLTANYVFFSIPLELKFTAFNRATDTVNGQGLDYVVSQTIVEYDNAPLLFILSGGVYEGTSVPWGIAPQFLVNDSILNSTLNGYVPGSRTVNSKPLNTDITLTASDVGALPNSTAIPSKTSDLTNDSGYITLGDLPIYNGGVS